MTNTHTHPEPEIAAGHRPISGLGRTKNDLLGQIYCTLSVEKLLPYTPKLFKWENFCGFHDFAFNHEYFPVNFW